MNKKIILNIFLTLIFSFLLYFFFLPPINIQAPEFYIFVGLILFFYVMISMITYASNDIINIIVGKKKNKFPYKSIPILIGIFIGTIAIILLLNFILSPLFNSKSYSKRIIVNEKSDFNNDIKQVDFNAIPLLDKDSSSKLGDRVMGQMPELVSQFYVSDLYTQINYNDSIVRVTPLEYNGLIKYLTNHKDGVKGYITVNSVTGETKLTKLDRGMKYMPSAILMEDLDRHVRFSYPTSIFGEKTFEIDNEGNPYWVVPVIKYTGIGLKTDISGVILVDAITGKMNKYAVKDVPTWVDHVYSASLIIEQISDWGQYRDGFINSIFGQKNVVVPTTGYNYTVMNDDVYLYTGITSVTSDESNIGFILTNMRTKETSFYSVAGAEEYSAMASAEGQVQQMKYKASFPLLINLNDKPTYLISLKDNAGLVKMYALVDVADYQKVVVTDASKGIEEASRNYLSNVSSSYDNNSLLSKNITVKSITSAIIDGNSYYYIIDNSGLKYRASIKINNKKIPFIKENDVIKIRYSNESDITEIIKIEF